MEKKHLFITVLLSLVFVCVMISTAVSQDTSKVYNFKYYSTYSPAMAMGMVESRFVDSVRQATSGRVIITPYWNASLLPRQESWKGLLNGVYEIAQITPDNHPGEFPVLDIVHLPFFFGDAYETNKALRAIYNKGMMPELNKIKQAGFRATSVAMIGFTKKEVKNLEDLKGMKIRSASGEVGEIIASLGAVPVGGIVSADLYMSLNRGVVDGLISTNSYMPTQKLYEVIKYVVDAPFYTGSHIMVMNMNAWNSLPNDIKAIMEKEFANAENDWLNMETEEGKKGKEAMIKNGVKYYPISSAEIARWRQATQGELAKYVKRLNDRGLPGQKIVDEAKAAMGSK